ncbi:MAG: 1-acyl-sn-glycerol-3-phosphate acyltransferase [Anaerolineales bacterium]|nr:1-acyl-sn-glycerol-3-phosphate acyltransferase [Anaerolineales bacterium]MBX3038896.1 1-acyl-sn-glycerol-3-phosphate acyltransferase [Anaerolineales bacterium]
MYWLTVFLIRIWIRLTCQLDMTELQKVPMNGPLIAITNHTGQVEVPIMFAYLQPRKITAWAKAEAFDNLFLKVIFGIWNVIPVRRGEADIKSLKIAVQMIKDGYIFGIAPEGTRNKTGKLLRAQPGTVLLALHSGAPILPIVHWGGEHYLKNLKSFKRTDFYIRVGEPFKLNVEGVKMTSEIRQQIADEMMYEIAKMLPEEYRGEYRDLSKATRQFLS